MENYIPLPNNNKIYIDDRIQSGSLGEPFRLSQIRINEAKPEKWINRVLKNHYVYLFMYTDKSIMFEIEIDYYDNFVEKRIV